MSEGKIRNLQKDVQVELMYWDEHSQFTLAGVPNLSKADMDTLLLYCDTWLTDGNVNSLMPLSGGPLDVWNKYSN